MSTEGVLWKEQRRFSHSVLKELGMGKGFLEPKVLEEIQVNIFMYFANKCSQLSFNSTSPYRPQQKVKFFDNLFSKLPLIAHSFWKLFNRLP